MAIDTLISGGTLVGPSEMYEASLAIDRGKILAVGAPEALPDAIETIDATDKLVLPGVVDPHVHIDDMFSIDSYESATAAAALGGVTTVIDFGWQGWDGNTSPYDDTVSLLEGIRRKKGKIRDSYIDIALHGGITRDDPAVLDEISEAVDQGVTSFKMYTTYEMGLTYGFIERAFESISEREAVAVVHTENDSVCKSRTARLRRNGRGAPTSYPDSRPDYAEAMAAENAVRLAMEHGCKYYGFHTTCRKAVEELAQYRERYGPQLVRAETCTQYAVLDDSIYDELGNLAMIAPPIRPEADRNAMVEHIDRGTLDVISSDHCAYTRASKVDRDWWDSSFGANGLQTELPVIHDELINERGLSYERLVQVKCRNPARLFGLPQKGTLEPGTDADIVIFDPSETYEINAVDNASYSDFTLYEGREVSGAVDTTLVRGVPVVVDGELLDETGHGAFTERSIPQWTITD